MPRDTRYTINEPDGTPFQELVMFPTLAPQLARPQHAAPPNASTNGAGVAAPGALPVAATAEENNGKPWMPFLLFTCLILFSQICLILRVRILQIYSVSSSYL